MKPQSRFIKSIIATSKQQQPAMPWHRGATRAAFVAGRKQAAPQARRA
ncbi:hypothetical protein [Tropicibacter oceani]|uniref:Uncharacterized protein n=1 Tax=Tropicibacter oceani TaxID=3058420 RepID=A0ABY8QHU2_9RHOB|nr:hypothetical protein [Tropicibacter oceani]WGW04226.1 hypothetical protein QF118_01435 [Tropicibacter oceani]